MKKRTQVHILPTEGKSEIFKTDNKGLLGFNMKGPIPRDIEGGIIPQHLYFTTDEEIKEGDWCYSDVDEEVYQMLEYNSKTGLSRDKDGTFILDGCRKIIATTDPKLYITIGEHYNAYNKEFPKPSQALIKDYCEQGGFDEVDVEYELNSDWHIDIKGLVKCKNCNIIDTNITNRQCDCNLKLKVDPIHNTITTHRIVEKMYSLSEAKEMFSDLYHRILPNLDTGAKIKWESWIKENL